MPSSLCHTKNNVQGDYLHICKIIRTGWRPEKKWSNKAHYYVYATGTCRFCNTAALLIVVSYKIACHKLDIVRMNKYLHIPIGRLLLINMISSRLQPFLKLNRRIFLALLAAAKTTVSYLFLFYLQLSVLDFHFKIIFFVLQVRYTFVILLAVLFYTR